MSILKPIAYRIKYKWKERSLANCAEGDVLRFTCNICSHASLARVADLGRDDFTCIYCHSSVRMRSVAHLLCMELFKKPLLLPELPMTPEINGIGLSDPDALAQRLGEKFNYQNTYYHQEPRLDITQIDASWENRFDFLISSDVFEHVAPPVSRAFSNAYRLLKPNGFMILTVPYHLDQNAIEHFPNLHDYRIEKTVGGYRLLNTTLDGKQEVFDRLIFHGGPGSTLEMRFFSMSSILAYLDQAGFDEVVFCSKDYPKYGISWPYTWSLPVLARKRACS
jgi:SAM-dependent methyltransferase